MEKKDAKTLVQQAAEKPDRKDLNLETGLLSWQELVRFFARGVVVKVDSSLDLVEVAHTVASDDTDQFTTWMLRSLVARATDDDARDWNSREPDFWAVVTAPWVLVQENSNGTNEAGSDNETTADDRTLH